MSIFPLVFIVSCYILSTLRLSCAGTVSQGGNCTLSNNRLDASTHKFFTDCNDKTFCTPQGTCEPKQCRKDEFPFGYDTGEPLPALCTYGQYCPDEGDACKPWLALGQTCQLNRDDECSPPPSLGGVTNPLDSGAQSPMNDNMSSNPINANGSICLHFTCMYANATLGTPCIIESTVYVGLGPKGEQFSTTVARDNCKSPGLYCNTTSNACEKTQAVGQPCQKDPECQSYNCNIQNVCANPPETPVEVALWQYILTSIAVLTAMIATCVILVLVHKRHRKRRYAEMREYYREQLGYRKSIIALHSVAANSGPNPFYSQTKSALNTTNTLDAYGGYVDDKTCTINTRGMTKQRQD